MTKEEKRIDERKRVEEFIRSEITTPSMIQDIIAKGQGKGFYPWNRDRLKVLVPDLIKLGILKLEKEARGSSGAMYIACQGPINSEIQSEAAGDLDVNENSQDNSLNEDESENADDLGEYN
jgi:hypothetical protein